MSTSASQVHESIIAAVRQTGRFRAVSGSAGGMAAPVPRAAVALTSVEPLACDDCAATRWFRLRAEVVLSVRGQDPRDAVARAYALYEACADALNEDPGRQGLCRDLPDGPATEVGKAELVQGTLAPEIEVVFDVLCRFEQSEDQP